MRTLFATLLLAASMSAAATKERWIYLPANYQVDAEAERVLALLKRAKSAGYTHALLADSKFARLGDVIPRYFSNAARVRDEAGRLGIGIIPAVFPVGYSNSLLYHNPNLAEGLPVRDAPFEVRDGTAIHVPDPSVRLKDGTMEDRKAWAFVDDNLTIDRGAMRSGPTSANARLAHKLALTPFRQYHVSVRVRTAAFTGGTAEIKVIAADGTQLQWTDTGVKPDQEWTTHHITFNSLSHSAVTLYFGVWGGHQGDIWWDDATIGECALVNLLRRPGAPLSVKLAGGRELKEGTDFEPLKDPAMGITPWPGEYTAWHEPPGIKVRGLANGTRLSVSCFHPHIIYDGQVCACPSEPATMRLLEDQAARIAKLWGAKTHLMSHDEWRVLGWDAACQSRHLSPGRIAADNARACAAILRRTNPDARIAVWSDMFDPAHNAVDRYYLVNGTLKESWTGLDPSVVIVNWNSGRAAESLKFFADRGHLQILAGYYDASPAAIRPWLTTAKGVSGVIGVMFTTWHNNYTDLEAFARELDAGGF